MNAYHQLMSRGLSGQKPQLSDIQKRPFDAARIEYATKPATSPATFRPARLPLGFGPEGSLSRRQRRFDRVASRGRKRLIGGSGCMPHAIRAMYTEGERAALTIIALEFKRKGRCELPVDAIAARAGVSRRTVQYGLEHARAQGHIRVKARYRRGQRGNYYNLITITSADWCTWLRRGPSMASLDRAAKGCKGVRTTEKTEINPATEAGCTPAASGQGMGSSGQGSDLRASAGSVGPKATGESWRGGRANEAGPSGSRPAAGRNTPRFHPLR